MTATTTACAITRCLQRLGGGRNASYDVIDEKVRALVERMNVSGLIATIGSCEGHAWPPGNPPYVYFRTSSLSVADALHQRLEAAYAQRRLKSRWTLKPMFNLDRELCFVLRAPRLEVLSFSATFSVLAFKLLRGRVDSDFAVLRDVVGEVLAGRQPDMHATDHRNPCAGSNETVTPAVVTSADGQGG